MLLGEPDGSLEGFQERGGYAVLPPAADIVAAAARAELRGAGGAGFPTGTKLAAVAGAAGPRAVVVNGEEGEPASVKDRWMMRHRPHLVLDGLRTAAAAVDADRLICYVSDPDSACALRAAVREAPSELASVVVEEVEPAYVAGEETAVVNRLSGGEAKPLRKPPRPFEEGVDGRPTLVLNVESAARLAMAARGLDEAGGSLLATVLIAGEAVLLEVPRGTPLASVTAQHPGWSSVAPGALFLGGFAGGVWRAETLSLPVGHDEFRKAGALWGCGAVIVLDDSECVVAAALDVATYLRESSSGQCGSCVRGTQVVVEQLVRIANGTGTAEDLTQLEKRAQALVGRGNCALPDADAVLVSTLLTNFDTELRAHLDGSCATCRGTVFNRPGGGASTRFRAVVPS